MKIEIEKKELKKFFCDVVVSLHANGRSSSIKRED
jgi:hypothetical protein